MLAALVPAMLVIAQPDLGSGLVYIAVAVTVLFVAGVPWRHLAGLAALGAVAITLVLVAAPAVGVHVLKPYQTARLTAFLNPPKNSEEEGYQQEESQIAIGSGQKTGRGENATQTKLHFVPEDNTDFIFAAIGEQYGFVGAALVLSLYALLIWRALRILTMSKDLFGSLIAGGVVAMLMFQVFVNVGMAIGIMPITGVTLPLMSYGGSSVIATLLAVGLLQSIYVQARAAEALKGRVLRH
jgi:rod shape determining protein RodA